jgi:hypothetical protein
MMGVVRRSQATCRNFNCSLSSQKGNWRRSIGTHTYQASHELVSRHIAERSHGQRELSGGRAATAVVKAAQEALFARRGALTAKFFFVHREEACMGRLLRGRGGSVSAAISHPWGISAATHGGMRQKAANFDVLFDLPSTCKMRARSMTRGVKHLHCHSQPGIVPAWKPGGRHRYIAADTNRWLL